MARPAYVALAGMVASATVVAAADLSLIQEQPVAFWAGFAFIGMLGSIVLLAAKKWAENLFEKLVKLPTSVEIFDAINNGSATAKGYHDIVLAEMALMRKEVHEVKESFQSQLHSIEGRTVAMEMRHETEDRLARRERSA